MNEFKSWVDGKLVRERADVYNNNKENNIYFSKNHATTRNRPKALNFNHSLAIYYSLLLWFFSLLNIVADWFILKNVNFMFQTFV